MNAATNTSPLTHIIGGGNPAFSDMDIGRHRLDIRHYGKFHVVLGSAR
jgi:hypothetical protein